MKKEAFGKTFQKHFSKKINVSDIPNYTDMLDTDKKWFKEKVLLCAYIDMMNIYSCVRINMYVDAP